jgi:hypothetical protein
MATDKKKKPTGNKAQQARRAYFKEHGLKFSSLGTKGKRRAVKEYQVQKQQSKDQTYLNNANVQGPAGSSTWEIDPVTGQATQKVALSGEQQNIYNQGVGLTNIGQDLATQKLQGYQGFNFNEGNQRGQIEDNIFNSLTRGLQQKRALERDQLEQTLYNRGIPLDPNDRLYQSYMEDFDRRYDDIETNARGQATQQAQQQMQDAYNRGITTHQQGMSDISGLQGQGVGLLMPQGQQYQGGGNLNYGSPTQDKVTFTGLKQSQQQIDNQNAYQQGMLGVAQMNAATNSFAAHRPPGGGQPTDDFNV